MNNRIYADHNAGSPLRPEALKAMLPFFDQPGNPMSLHADGRETRAAIERARDAMARLLGARHSEIVFTSGGTESVNLALQGVSNAAGTKRVVVSAVEHPAGLSAVPDAVAAPVKEDGTVDLDALRELAEGACLVSVMHANNETGAVQPVKEAARIAHEAGAFFHTDAAQSAGKIPVHVDKMDVDLLSISGYKFGGPRGVGALYARNGLTLQPLLRGGPQERQRRPGTENAPAIVGMAAALEAAVLEMSAAEKRLRKMTRRFIEQARQLFPETRLNTPPKSVPGAVNISFKNLSAENLTIALDLLGVSVSTGAACASGSVEPSHVLRAMRLPDEYARGAVRFSFGYCSPESDIDETLSALKTALQRTLAAA